MNVRIQFAKFGSMKFIGHLDVMRYFQKAVRRAGIDVVYSQGYHPHQIMSFACPLGVGVTGETEFLDLEVKGEFTPKEIADRLDQTMTDGFRVISCRILPEPQNGRKRETAMSLITAADYLFSLKDTAVLSVNHTDMREKWKEFLSQNEIALTREVKKSGTQETLDIKPYLYLYGFTKSDILDTAPISDNYYRDSDRVFFSENPKEIQRYYETYENGLTFSIRLSCGSAVNIRPEELLSEFCAYCNILFRASDWQVHRFGLYTGTYPQLLQLM